MKLCFVLFALFHFSTFVKILNALLFFHTIVELKICLSKKVFFDADFLFTPLDMNTCPDYNQNIILDLVIKMITLTSSNALPVPEILIYIFSIVTSLGPKGKFQNINFLTYLDVQPYIFQIKSPIYFKLSQIRHTTFYNSEKIHICKS